MKSVPRARSAGDSEGVTLDIVDLAFGGDGVARLEGKVWFVPWTLPGERVLARARRSKKDFVQAELLEILEASPRRVEPACPYFSICGGCRYQHLDYAGQLAAKRKQVADVVARVGKRPDLVIDEVVASPLPYGYRNRITVHIVDGVAGFHRADGRGLIEIERCAIADEEVNERLTNFREKSLYDGHRTLRSYDDPAGFRQTNDGVAALLGRQVREWAAGTAGAGGWLIDAFCGSGFFAHALRAEFEEVVGIDWSEGAVAAAERRAFPGETYLQGDVEEVLPGLLARRADRDDGVIILDPPAEGLTAKLVEALKQFPVGRLIYVSCHPATFSRDAALLSPVYRLEQVVPFDMFPQTAEIELAARFVPVAVPFSSIAI